MHRWIVRSVALCLVVLSVGTGTATAQQGTPHRPKRIRTRIASDTIRATHRRSQGKIVLRPENPSLRGQVGDTATAGTSGSGGPQLAQQCGTTPSNPCMPRAYISLEAPTPALALPTESGPITLNVRISNNGGAAGDFELTCSGPTQLPCLDGNQLGTYYLEVGQGITIPARFNTLGIGQFRQTYIAYAYSVGGPNLMNGANVAGGGGGGDGWVDTDTLKTPLYSVTGNPIQVHLLPGEGQAFEPGDSLVVVASHTSGIAQSSFRANLNGVDISSLIVDKTSTGFKIKNPYLTAGTFTFSTVVCANSGRCDSVVSHFTYTGPPTVWALDDSLPMDQELEAAITPMLGPLALPPMDRRGCPVTSDHPDLRLVRPMSEMSQPAVDGGVSGLFFTAGIETGSWIRVSHLSVDRTPADGVTCDNMGPWLTPADYNYRLWTATDPNDPLWSGYPYGDHLAFTPQAGTVQRFAALEPMFRHRTGGAKGLSFVGERLTELLRSRPRVSGDLFDAIPNPGAIDINTYTVTINNVPFITNNVAVRPGVVIEAPMWQGGGIWKIPAGDTVIRKYDMNAPPGTQPNGWNEMVASIADSTGHRTYVRARWLQMPDGVIAPVAPKSLRNYARFDQGACAAYGPMQCGSVVFARAIPGFTTRDKDRSLHLVYRSGSQRAQRALPLSIYINRAQAAPDSFLVVTRDSISGTVVGDSLRYVGLYGAVTGTGSNNLNDAANESRALSADLRPLGLGAAPAIRKLQVEVHSFRAGTSGWNDYLNLEVPEITLKGAEMTRFGDGWQLAELSRMVVVDSVTLIQLEGDGSYGVWKRKTGVWTPPIGVVARLTEYPSTPNDGARYVIFGSDGSSTGYRADGWVIWNKDLLGNPARFVYDSNPGNRLAQINDTTGYRYRFVYNSAEAPTRVGQIDVISPYGDTTRMVTLRYSTGGQLLGFKVWRTAATGHETTFGYDTTVTDGALLTSITDPRSTPSLTRITSFAYDPTLRTPYEITRPDGMRWLYRDAWRRAAPRAGYARPGKAAERLVYLGQVRGTGITPGNPPGEFKVDPFGAPTWVRSIAPETAMQFPFSTPAYDQIRHIERDSAGRVLRIVSQRYLAAVSDSVMYSYDALGRITQLIRPTAMYPLAGTITLDTVRFAYDSVTQTNGAWCSRMLRSIDVMGDTTSFTYGATGNGRCFPTKIVGLGGETTRFTYGVFSAGVASAGRPIIVDPQTHVRDSIMYNSTNMNTRSVKRLSDGATSTTTFSNAFGRPITATDPMGVVSYVCYDFSGRVTRTRGGSVAAVPATATTYDAADHPIRADVFVMAAGSPCTATVPTDTSLVQTTQTYLDRLDRVDSIVGPGRRTGANPTARKQSYRVFDDAGRPLWSFSGNGTYIVRTYDWAGRPLGMGLSAVDPTRSLDGEAFALPVVLSEYTNQTTFHLSMGAVQSMGQQYGWGYDTRGLPIYEVGRDEYEAYTGNQDSMYVRRRGYSRRGALIADSLRFTAGAFIVRRYEYDRRGQRVRVADTTTVAVGHSMAAGNTFLIPGDSTIRYRHVGQTSYVYGAHTARLDSLISTVDSSGATFNVARIAFTYDSAGRPASRRQRIGSDSYDLVTTWAYDGSGRLADLLTSRDGKTWYRNTPTAYDSTDRLLSYTGDVGVGLSTVHFGGASTYEAGTGRLWTSTRSEGGTSTSYVYTYNAFGNRLTQQTNHTNADTPCLANTVTYNYGADNRITGQTGGFTAPCIDNARFLTDQAGNRIGEVHNEGYSSSSIQKMTYTAANQLYFSHTTTESPGNNNVNWNWYGADGMRLITASSTTVNWESPPPPTAIRSYYVYDGPDVAMVLTRNGTGWSVRQRFVSLGIDQPVAGRFATTSSGVVTLSLVGDEHGTTVAALRPDGTLEPAANYCRKDAFGARSFGTCGGTLALETGFTGASTPNSSGGFVYLRNRWYDPRTGRFLTQDPIGLAGGVNLYAYAGNNPVGFSDPWGLSPEEDCPPCRDQTPAEGRASVDEAKATVAAIKREGLVYGQDRSKSNQIDCSGFVCRAEGHPHTPGLDQHLGTSTIGNNPNFRVLGPNEHHQAGDIMVQPAPTGTSAHMGMWTGEINPRGGLIGCAMGPTTGASCSSVWGIAPRAPGQPKGPGYGWFDNTKPLTWYRRQVEP